MDLSYTDTPQININSTLTIIVNRIQTCVINMLQGCRKRQNENRSTGSADTLLPLELYCALFFNNGIFKR